MKVKYSTGFARRYLKMKLGLSTISLRLLIYSKVMNSFYESKNRLDQTLFSPVAPRRSFKIKKIPTNECDFK